MTRCKQLPFTQERAAAWRQLLRVRRTQAAATELLTCLFYISSVDIVSSLSRVTAATLDVLEVLLDGDVEPYGLAIAKAAHLATGSVFPILARLERIGWVRSYWEESDRPGARRRFYELNPDGIASARALLTERRGKRGWPNPIPGGAW